MVDSCADDDLTSVSQMAGLEELNLSGNALTDAGMIHLTRLKKLQRLVLMPGLSDRHERIGDAGIQHLSELSELTTLSLFNTRITDAGLTHLTGLGKLKTLSLGNTLITASGIKTLEQLLSLEQLDISGTKMKNAEQLDFRKMPSLKRLVAFEFDERKILLPDGCYVTTFD